MLFSWLLTMYHPADAAHPYDWGFVGAMSPIVACTIGLVLALYMVFKGAFSATYTVDAGGYDHLFSQAYLSAFVGRTVWSLRSCPSWSTTAPRSGSFIAPQRRFPKGTGQFLPISQKRLCAYQFFQLCDEEAYQEFLSCIPERARNYLEAEMPVHGLTWERK